MFRGLRLSISILTLLAMLAGGIGGAAAVSNHHHDCAIMAMDDSPCNGDEGIPPPCHDSMSCAGLQVLPPLHFSVLIRAVDPLTLCPVESFSFPPGLSLSPDIRPPII